jgi:hypothetical protein
VVPLVPLVQLDLLVPLVQLVQFWVQLALLELLEPQVLELLELLVRVVQLAQPVQLVLQGPQALVQLELQVLGVQYHYLTTPQPMQLDTLRLLVQLQERLPDLVFQVPS